MQSASNATPDKKNLKQEAEKAVNKFLGDEYFSLYSKTSTSHEFEFKLKLSDNILRYYYEFLKKSGLSTHYWGSSWETGGMHHLGLEIFGSFETINDKISSLPPLSIQRAITDGAIDVVLRMINKNWRLLNQKVLYEGILRTPLEIAAITGQADLVAALVKEARLIKEKITLDDEILKSGTLTPAVINVLDDVIYDKLIYFIVNKNLDELEKLININPSCVNYTKHDSELPPFAICLSCNNSEALRLLLQHGAEIQKKYSTMLFTKSDNQNVTIELVKILIEFGGTDPDIHAEMLWVALKKDLFEVANFLATLKINWKDDHAALMHLAFTVHPDIIPLLCTRGANINQVNEKGLTMMHRASLNEFSNELSIHRLKILFNCNADPTLLEPHSYLTPFQLAYTKNNYIITQYISDYTRSKNNILNPKHTIEVQLKQLAKLEAKNRPLLQFDQKRILTRLQELEKIEMQLRQEKEILIAMCDKKPITVNEYNSQDLAEMKAIIDFHTDKLAGFPVQAPELLRKVSVASRKTSNEFMAIILDVFTGINLSEVDSKELHDELNEINILSNTNKEQFNFKHNINYSQNDIAKMVYDTAIITILEKQYQFREPEVSNNNIKSIAVTTAMKNFGSPVMQAKEVTNLGVNVDTQNQPLPLRKNG